MTGYSLQLRHRRPDRTRRAQDRPQRGPLGKTRTSPTPTQQHRASPVIRHLLLFPSSLDPRRSLGTGSVPPRAHVRLERARVLTAARESAQRVPEGAACVQARAREQGWPQIRRTHRRLQPRRREYARQPRSEHDTIHR